jgi:hypothetical protein
MGRLLSETIETDFKVKYEYGSSWVTGATVLLQISWKLVRKVVLMISVLNCNMGHLWSKTRSQDQRKEKAC